MKTKYLIAMLAAPMFFAACSQDELINSVPGTEKIEGTPYGDQLLFNVEDGNNATTRVTTGGKWEAGDQIGMAWITDGYFNVTVHTDGDLNNFSSATKVIGNVPLNFVSGTAFKSNTMMFVGTYLAYRPFNEELKTVGELKLSVGANQISKDLSDAYNKTVFASDTLALLPANAGTGKTPTINMKRLSNMLVLDICLKANSTTMKAPVIQKVELDIKTTGTPGTSLLATAGTVVPNFWVVSKTKESDKAYFKDLGTNDNYLTPTDLSLIAATTAEDLTVSKEQYATVYMNFMPSDISTADATNSIINIYTNYGVIKSSVADAVKVYNWDTKTEAYSTTAATDVKTAFDSHSKVAGRLIKKKVEIDLSKVSVDELTATNAAEIRKIVDNWKLSGSTSPITINVTHDAAYLANFDANEADPDKNKDIILDGLNLSDIPAALTIKAKDVLVFTGTTNLNSSNAITIKDEYGTGAVDVVFAGTTSIGTLNTNGAIAFNENTTIYGTLTQVPTAGTDVISVATGKTLTVNAGNLISNTTTYSKLVNSGTISLINSGAINGNVAVGTNNLNIVNYTEIPESDPTAYNEGTINVGDADSQGYIKGITEDNFDNDHGTIRFFNGDFVAPETHAGLILAVAQTAMQFSAAVAKEVTTIEITGEINFTRFDLTEAAGKKTTVVMKSGSKLNLGTKTITLGNVKVAENATVEGKKLIVFGGKLAIMPNATLTVADNTVINAKTLDLPSSAKIQGNAENSVVVYKSAGLVGGTYTANVSQNSSLAGVE